MMVRIGLHVRCVFNQTLNQTLSDEKQIRLPFVVVLSHWQTLSNPLVGLVVQHYASTKECKSQKKWINSASFCLLQKWKLSAESWCSSFSFSAYVRACFPSSLRQLWVCNHVHSICIFLDMESLISIVFEACSNTWSLHLYETACFQSICVFFVGRSLKWQVATKNKMSKESTLLQVGGPWAGGLRILYASPDTCCDDLGGWLGESAKLMDPETERIAVSKATKGLRWIKFIYVHLIPCESF